MNRFVALIALAIALGGPASAQTSYQIASDSIIAGQVNVDGSVNAGTGFKVHRSSTGKYRIDFPKSTFCPILTVTGFGRTSDPPIAEVHQPWHCSQIFYVRFFLPVNESPLDQAFNFVAVWISNR